MAVLKRAELPGGATVRQEVVAVPSLGADVIVRGRSLADSMLLLALGTADKPEGEDKATERERTERQVRRGVEIICETLRMQVVLEDGEPMWTAAQWEEHGAAQPSELLDLYKVAERLAGADTKDLAKN